MEDKKPEMSRMERLKLQAFKNHMEKNKNNQAVGRRPSRDKRVRNSK